jgi:hypothetical protein
MLSADRTTSIQRPALSYSASCAGATRGSATKMVNHAAIGPSATSAIAMRQSNISASLPTMKYEPLDPRVNDVV